MKHPYQIIIYDKALAEQTKNCVKIGHYFVFAEDPSLSRHKQGVVARLGRLLVKTSNKVFPLTDKPVTFEGITIKPEPRAIHPLGCLVADRDLYRAGEDNVNLFIAFPCPPETLHLIIECNGECLTKRKVALTKGVGTESFATLLPGDYSAHLETEKDPIGIAARFTVAEYRLAPLSARLITHNLSRETDDLFFTLNVESYQMPFRKELIVELIEKNSEISRTRIRPVYPGRYDGNFPISGEGPFRLRLIAAEDHERVAEVVIPGSRKTEREITVINELGTEMQFSMMPEAGALPIRGGYLTEGDILPTPLTVAETVTDTRVIQVNENIESLVLVCLDLMTGDYSIQKAGHLEAGSEITAESRGSVSMVFAGCFVNGHPFEGYTTFIEPSRLCLSMETPDTVRPKEKMTVRLKCEGTDRPVPVLLCVRDERLTATDTPNVALGASAKKGIDAAVAGMDEAGIAPLTLLPKDIFVHHHLTPENTEEHQADDETDDLELEFALDLEPDFEKDGVESVEEDFILNMELDLDLELEPESEPDQDLSVSDMLSSGFDTIEFDANKMYSELDELSEESDEQRPLINLEGASGILDMSNPEQGDESPLKKGQAPGTIRSEFPEMLFYGIVSVSGADDISIPMGDAPGTFSVEAFAMDHGDWTQRSTSVIVDQPVRIDLELPPAVHPRDQVTGRLRGVSASGQARISLMCNGKPVLFANAGKSSDVCADAVNTPTELTFSVRPGTYTATIEDLTSGETDAVEAQVGEPGRFRFYTKKLALLKKGESASPDMDEVIGLRVLPGLNEPFDMLVKATADYAHLCCEQTAAKILAAVFMYLSSKSVGERIRGEQMILNGIERQQKMLRPGWGFTMYAEESHVDEYYSKLAVRYLWKLNLLSDIPDLSENLQNAVREGISLADRAAKVHGIKQTPDRICSAEDAYTLAASGKDVPGVRKFVEKLIDFSGMKPCLKKTEHAVSDRADMAYAAAALVATGDLEQGVMLANQVTRQFNARGALYSTVDSAAAMTLLAQLIRSGVASDSGRVRVNTREMTTQEASRWDTPVQSVEVREGIAVVEMTKTGEEDWGARTHAFPVSVGFRNSKGRKVRFFRPGDRAELICSLPDGYQTGDIVHVALPACMSWIHGGGKVRRFSADFEGKNELRIPVVVSSEIRGKQRFAVCVRNMFREERAASPGILTIEEKFPADKYFGTWRIIETESEDPEGREGDGRLCSSDTDEFVRELKSAVLSLEWEISDQVMQTFEKEVSRLRRAFSDDKIVLGFLKLFDSLSRYISEKKSDSHPDAVSLLGSVYEGLESVITSPKLSDAERKKTLLLRVASYRKLKAHISMAETPESFMECCPESGDQDYLTFDPDDVSKFRIGDIQGTMDCRIVRYEEFEKIEFSWKGKSGNLLASGRGWTYMRSDRLKGRLFIHDGEDFGFIAVRMPKS